MMSEMTLLHCYCHITHACDLTRVTILNCRCVCWYDVSLLFTIFRYVCLYHIAWYLYFKWSWTILNAHSYKSYDICVCCTYWVIDTKNVSTVGSMVDVLRMLHAIPGIPCCCCWYLNTFERISSPRPKAAEWRIYSTVSWYEVHI